MPLNAYEVSQLVKKYHAEESSGDAEMTSGAVYRDANKLDHAIHHMQRAVEHFKSAVSARKQVAAHKNKTDWGHNTAIKTVEVKETEARALLAEYMQQKSLDQSKKISLFDLISPSNKAKLQPTITTAKPFSWTNLALKAHSSIEPQGKAEDLWPPLGGH